MFMKPVQHRGVPPMPLITPKDAPAAPVVLLREHEKLKALFKGCDRNRDGVLDKNELREAFKRKLGSHLPNWRAYRGMHHADANGDGLISESELAELVKYAQEIGYTFHGYI